MIQHSFFPGPKSNESLGPHLRTHGPANPPDRCAQQREDENKDTYAHRDRNHWTCTHSETHKYMQLPTVIGPDSLFFASTDVCLFANVKLVIVHNNKDETDIKSVNILTDALNTL